MALLFTDKMVAMHENHVIIFFRLHVIHISNGIFLPLVILIVKIGGVMKWVPEVDISKVDNIVSANQGHSRKFIFSLAIIKK